MIRLFQRGQASFEIILLVGFIFALSALILSNYFQIGPSIEGIGIVKSVFVSDLAGMTPANEIIGVHYGQYVVDGVEHPSFTVQTRTPLCESLSADRALDSLQRVSGLSNSVIRSNTCKSLLVKSEIVYAEGGTSADIQKGCSLLGKTPLLMVKSFDGAGVVLDTAETDIDFDSTATYPATAFISPGATKVQIRFANDCCLGWNGRACTLGTTDVKITGVQLEDKVVLWKNPVTLFENGQCVQIGLSDGTKQDCS